VLTPTGSMTTRRDGRSATLPDNGPVLMADGAGATAAAELYNPASERDHRHGQQARESAMSTRRSPVMICRRLPGDRARCVMCPRSKENE